MEFGRSNRAGGRVNVYDVARAAGVSHQTVSNALNNPDRVRPATREKVLRAVEDLNYEVNAVARSLGAGRSSVLGLQVPRVRAGTTGGFFEHFVLALAEAARARAYNVLIFSVDDDGAAEHARLHRARLVDGVVIADTELHDRRIQELSSLAVPFVSFGRTADGVDYPWVDVDNRVGVRMSVQHLASAGHQRIGYVGPASDTFYGNERVGGLQEAIADLGLEWRADHVVEVGDDLAAARAATESLLRLDDGPSALIAGSDYLAAAVLEVARSLGRPVGPDGLAVIGFDDTPLAALLTPPVTTVRQPIALIAEQVVDLLLDRVAERPVENRLLEPVLVPRASA